MSAFFDNSDELSSSTQLASSAADQEDSSDSTSSNDSDPVSSDNQQACLSAAQDDANASFSNGSTGAPVISCDMHWISLRLIREPDLKPRPSWWRASEPLPYPSESYRAEITDGTTDGSLNGDAFVRFDKIPAGSCQFSFTRFYKDVEQFFRDQLQGQ